LRNKVNSLNQYKNNDGGIIYGKGVAYFRQLEKLIGAEELQKGL
jgi:aminopeptidase N